MAIGTSGTTRMARTAGTTKVARASSISAGILAELEQDQTAAIERIAGARTLEDITGEIERIDQAMTQMVEVKDKAERDTRQAILTAKLEELHAEVRRETEDLSTAVMGLNALMEGMGREYENLQEASEDELRLVASAEARLEGARRSLQEANSAWFLRSKRVTKANSAIAEAEQGIVDTKARVAQMARMRLMSATMEQSLQNFMFKVRKTIDIMKARKLDIDKQIVAIGLRKVEAFKIKDMAAETLERLDAKLTELEGQLRADEETLRSLVNGSHEFVEQEAKVSELGRLVENTRGNRNTALVLFQSKERFALELEVHEAAQMKLRDNQRMWITALTSDTEERVATFRSRLEAMKAMSDQDIAKNLDDLGTTVDRKNTEFMAKVGRASDDQRMKMVESHPERVRRLAEIHAAQAEAKAAIMAREAVAIARFRERYGIDPMDSSFFTYQDKNGSAGESAATGAGA